MILIRINITRYSHSAPLLALGLLVKNLAKIAQWTEMVSGKGIDNVVFPERLL